jgi:hypothetical protein
MAQQASANFGEEVLAVGWLLVVVLLVGLLLM